MTNIISSKGILKRFVCKKQNNESKNQILTYQRSCKDQLKVARYRRGRNQASCRCNRSFIYYDAIDEAFVEIEVIRDQELTFFMILETDEDGLPEPSKLGIASDITIDPIVEEFKKR